jgi:lysyl-tRNA synthetase, class I
MAEQDFEEQTIIGRGTWLDKVASEVVAREKDLKRNLSMLRVESGLGASGIPHIGSLGDAARAYGVKMALEELGYSSELMAYSDDMDALRKVPAGLPDSLRESIGKPVSEIPDPEGCHESYGAHMSSLLLDGLDRLGLAYRFQSGYLAYKTGLLVPQIDAILQKADAIGSQIEQFTGQKKYLETLPYFAQCSNCKRLNVAKSISYDPAAMKVHYRCEGDEIGNQFVSGCGHEGEADIRKGEGKLSWKVEFAARWAAFDIRFEAHGKELTDSVRINDWICDNVLDFPHPFHVVYELFQDKGGRKISKSTGNLVTPQQWLSFASTQSLLMLYYKRIVGARNISVEDVPTYMDEFDSLEDVYFGKRAEPNKIKENRLKGLYFYSFLKQPPVSPSQHIPYGLLVELASVAPKENPAEYVGRRLLAYRAIKELTPDVERRIGFALNWASEFQLPSKPVDMTDGERAAITKLAQRIEQLSDPEALQAAIFTTGKEFGLNNSRFFSLLYQILLGVERGPRLGQYISDVGPLKVSKKLKETADTTVSTEKGP